MEQISNQNQKSDFLDFKGVIKLLFATPWPINTGF